MFFVFVPSFFIFNVCIQMNIDTDPIEAGLGFFIKPNKVSLTFVHLRLLRRSDK